MTESAWAGVDDEAVLTVPATALHLQLTERNIRRMVKDGRLESHRIPVKLNDARMKIVIPMRSIREYQMRLREALA